MQYAYIINPASGNGKDALELRKEIANQARYNPDVRFFETAGEKDATVLADMIATEAEASGEDVIIYACGGDGTVQEVATGILGHGNARLGVIPVGSGNDFVRCFDYPSRFKNLILQRSATPQQIDMLRLTWEEDGETMTSYAINGVNIGFDGNTAVLAHSLKEVPMIQGSASYAVAILVNLIQKKGANLRVTADGKQIYRGPLIMCTASNGRFCGGGIESCPKAELDNGKIELMVVGNVTRRFFLKVFPKFKAGRIFEVPHIERVIKSLQAEKVTVEPADWTMKFVADGEIMETTALTIEVMPKAITVMVP